MVCYGSLKGLFSPCECPHHRLKHHPSFTVVGCYLAQPIEHGPYVRLFPYKDNRSTTDYPNMKPWSAAEAAHGCECVLRKHGSLRSLFSSAVKPVYDSSGILPSTALSKPLHTTMFRTAFVLKIYSIFCPKSTV